MLRNGNDLIIDGVSMAQYCTKVKWGYHKIWSAKSGRNMAGTNSGSLVGIFPKITMTFRKLNEEEISIVLSLFNKAENKVTFYNPDVKKKYTNASFYSNDQELTQEYLGRIDGYSSAIISNKARKYYK